MAPQLSSKIDLDNKLNFTVNTALNRRNTSGKGLRYMNNSEAAIIKKEVLSDEQNKSREGPDDAVVTISEITNSDIRVPEAEDPDATDYSSSFAGTVSGNGNCSELSDAEVESQFYGDNDFTSAFDGFSSVLPLPMRKKKLTGHWRSFIRPLMWRCKWTELKIKEMESKSSKYSGVIEARNRRKQAALEQFALQGLASKSLPSTFRSHRKKAMKRRKRKRVEDSTDVKSYVSQHNLFSFHENKKTEQDGTSMADDLGSPDTVLLDQNTGSNVEFPNTNEWSFAEDKDNALEEIFRKIEMVHSRVHKLKGQLDLVMSKNVGRFSSSENLSHLVPYDALTSPTFSACNGDTVSPPGGLYTSNHRIPDYDMTDLVLPESAVSSYGEAIIIPDIIESTVGLLSSIDVTPHQPLIGDSCEDIVDNILRHNEAAAETETKNNPNQTTKKDKEPEKFGEEEGESTNPPLPALESNTLAKPVISQEQSALKPCLVTEFHFPKTKRKRGERKAGAGGWSRQCPGEPDSQ